MIVNRRSLPIGLLQLILKVGVIILEKQCGSA
jgi:hypothetical protein